jgi:hypothetical protein
VSASIPRAGSGGTREREQMGRQGSDEFDFSPNPVMLPNIAQGARFRPDGGLGSLNRLAHTDVIDTRPLRDVQQRVVFSAGQAPSATRVQCVAQQPAALGRLKVMPGREQVLVEVARDAEPPAGVSIKTYPIFRLLREPRTEFGLPLPRKDSADDHRAAFQLDRRAARGVGPRDQMETQWAPSRRS